MGLEIFYISHRKFSDILTKLQEPDSHDSLIAELSRPDRGNNLTFDFNLLAQNLTLKMRIPIPDKRDELHRAPWFQRRIREELIKIDLRIWAINKIN